MGQAIEPASGVRRRTVLAAAGALALGAGGLTRADEASVTSVSFAVTGGLTTQLPATY
ncbi:hypothetical protein ABZ912_53125 [Nonomuraea angiospora]|uniref:hypothetical protein n=1 Tax=Nonomuraea angiospora TaxID=46172 RepID=UPI0033F1D05E